jgi:hypothetical protein
MFLIAQAAYTFIIGSLENGSCDVDHLLPWIQQHAIKIPKNTKQRKPQE